MDLIIYKRKKNYMSRSIFFFFFSFPQLTT